ncbi:PREDICTED: rab GDP dissociation inhibitor alpha-like [Priapulus caudatus]|uniref:Rab GDP dissociation inhibitor n=1 Tax=Priapulus caudatus TaxID=37621 RepID=A0ABM1E3L4_PRICU|nr:PREDICTED: rab GDP dissociation inhibitor alpha-like [Priapulus caudatus]
MLDKPADELVMEDGHVVGVRSGGETAKCKMVVCDPSYVPERVKKAGQVARCICLMNHPVPNTKDSASCQIIIPQHQVGRHSDIYVCAVSASHQVAAKGWFVAMVSTTVETDKPEAELKVGLDLLGPVEEKFYSVADLYEPTDDGRESRIFVSKVFDATTHFETTCLDVLDIYKRSMGEDFDFSKVRHTLEEQE